MRRRILIRERERECVFFYFYNENVNRYASNRLCLKRLSYFRIAANMARLVLLALLVLMLSALALAQSGIPMSPCIVCAYL